MSATTYKGTLVDVVNEACATHPKRIAFSNFGSHMRFRDLKRDSDAFAAWLHAHPDLKPGDRVVIMLPNVMQFPVALLGVIKAGLIAVNVNPLYTAHELRRLLRDSEPRAAVVADIVLATFTEAANGLPPMAVVSTGIGDLLGPLKGAIVNLVSACKIKRAPSKTIYKEMCKATRFRRAVKRGQRIRAKLPVPAADDIALLQYTGGTTGTPKGAMLTHASLVANLRQAKRFTGLDDKHAHTIVTALPLYHIFSLTVNCLLFMHLGGTNLLITDPRKIGPLISTISKHRFTAITGVSTLFRAMLAHPKFARLDFSGLQLCVAGGMAVPADVAHTWKRVTGKTMLQGYGLTETSPVISFNPPDSANFDGSVGLPMPDTEVSIRDAHSRTELPVGEAGELFVRGPQVMRGYWRQPDATAAVLDDDGWLATGDIARLNRDGFLHIVGRIKDMIIVSGFNVFPDEIEDVLCDHDTVHEAACIGVDDHDTGQAVYAFVVLKPGARLDEAALKTFCRKKLTGYKIPQHFEQRTELPKTNVGKVLRRELRPSTKNPSNKTG